MITKWKVFNFKSVEAETALELAPLTIFAGANSSGKSTFLQSILLIAQTIGHRVGSRSVILNGSLARLGEFRDIHSADSTSDEISIGFELSVPDGGTLPAMIDEMSGRPAAFFYDGYDADISTVRCSLSFDAPPTGPDSEVAQLQPRLLNCRLRVSASGDEPEDKEADSSVNVIHAGHRGETPTSKLRSLSIGTDENVAAVDSLQWDVSLDASSQSELNERYRTAEAVGCVLRHFLPLTLTGRIDRSTEDAALLSAILSGERRVLPRRRFAQVRQVVIPAAAVQVIDNILRQSASDDIANLVDISNLLHCTDPDGLPLAEWDERLRSLGPRERASIRRALAAAPDLDEELARAFHDARGSDFRLVPIGPPERIRSGVRYIERLFATRLKYLGPLRDEPKARYPLSSVHDPFDVGLRGERTAAVLDIHKKRMVEFISASSFAASSVVPSVQHRSLESAVSEWLQYLGVADMVRSHDRGKFGHELKVSVNGDDRPHDLTHVGVGVSQVLPILVMSLLADHDTTLIFEQPELHLHPRVQTLLADFFLSMTALGKQCIVETHSEYLINRIRFRTAAATEDYSWGDATRVFFVERPGGGSRFREVCINEYGAVVDWPEGFFDQSQDEAEAILRAATAKRRVRRENAE